MDGVWEWGQDTIGLSYYQSGIAEWVLIL